MISEQGTYYGVVFKHSDGRERIAVGSASTPQLMHHRAEALGFRRGLEMHLGRPARVVKIKATFEVVEKGKA